MKIKRKVSKEEFAALPEAIQALYNLSGDTYMLDADDADDLRSALEQEKTNGKNIKKELDDLRKSIKDKEDENARNTGDIAALDASWQKKYNDLQTKYDTDLAAATGETATVMRTLTVDKMASEIASISTVPTLLEPVIRARLSAELVDGKVITRVLDKDGKPSALSVDDLKKELANNPEYKSIIKSGNQAGGSAPASHPGGSAPGSRQANPSENANLARMKPADLKAHIEAKGGPVAR